jgi:hypothetical protein
MPRSCDWSADYEYSVEDVHAAFYQEGYWEARLADIPVDEAKLESVRFGGASGDDGTVEVATMQLVRSHNLHSIVKQLHRGDVCVRRKETWGPLVAGIATGSAEGVIDGTPVHVSGTAELSSAASGGARLAWRMSVQVRVPLIGGKVERLLCNALDELLVREHRLTAQWLAHRA